MKRVVGSPQLLDKLESHVRAVDRVVDRILGRFPRPLHGGRAKRVAAIAAERMPVDHAESQMLLHRLAFDDFGAGQTRLMELVAIRPDCLKFDRQLIQDIHLAPAQRRKMLASLVEMTKDLGIVTLAEGIECSEEGEVCQELGFELNPQT